MVHDDVTYIPLLEAARRAVRAKVRLSELPLVSAGLYDEAVSSNTATESVYYLRLHADPTKALTAGHVENLIGKAYTCQVHSASGTMMVPTSPTATFQSQYVDQLEATNQQLEYRVSALESELRAFRPYMK